jgi:hypothetical protein
MGSRRHRQRGPFVHLVTCRRRAGEAMPAPGGGHAPLGYSMGGPRRATLGRFQFLPFTDLRSPMSLVPTPSVPAGMYRDAQLMLLSAAQRTAENIRPQLLVPELQSAAATLLNAEAHVDVKPGNIKPVVAANHAADGVAQIAEALIAGPASPGYQSIVGNLNKDQLTAWANTVRDTAIAIDPTIYRSEGRTRA